MANWDSNHPGVDVEALAVAIGMILGPFLVLVPIFVSSPDWFTFFQRLFWIWFWLSLSVTAILGAGMIYRFWPENKSSERRYPVTD